MDNKLADVYYDPGKIGSFGGVNALAKNVDVKNVKDWLISQETYIT